MHGLSCSLACGIFPDQGSNPCPLHWQADSYPLCHQGSPLNVMSTWHNPFGFELYSFVLFFMTDSWPWLPPRPRPTLQKTGVVSHCTASKGLMNSMLRSSASSPGHSLGMYPSSLFSISPILAQGLLMSKHIRKYLLPDCLTLTDCPRTRSFFCASHRIRILSPSQLSANPTSCEQGTAPLWVPWEDVDNKRIYFMGLFEDLGEIM